MFGGKGLFRLSPQRRDMDQLLVITDDDDTLGPGEQWERRRQVTLRGFVDDQKVEQASPQREIASGGESSQRPYREDALDIREEAPFKPLELRVHPTSEPLAAAELVHGPQILGELPFVLLG